MGCVWLACPGNTIATAVAVYVILMGYRTCKESAIMIPFPLIPFCLFILHLKSFYQAVFGVKYGFTKVSLVNQVNECRHLVRISCFFFPLIYFYYLCHFLFIISFTQCRGQQCISFGWDVESFDLGYKRLSLSIIKQACIDIDEYISLTKDNNIHG